MNIRLIAILVAAILLAHAVMIHLLLQTDSMAASAAGKKAEIEQADGKKDDLLPSGDATAEKTADRSAHIVAPYDAFSILHPLTIVPSSQRRAAPTL